jgi:hypothetical protein
MLVIFLMTDNVLVNLNQLASAAAAAVAILSFLGPAIRYWYRYFFLPCKFSLNTGNLIFF